MTRGVNGLRQRATTYGDFSAKYAVPAGLALDRSTLIPDAILTNGTGRLHLDSRPKNATYSLTYF